MIGSPMGGARPPQSGAPAGAQAGARTRARRWTQARARKSRVTPLAIFVRERLAQLGVRQAEFCRINCFDQGLMSRIQNSAITNLSLESALRLAIGLAVPPKNILDLIDRTDLHELVMAAYGIHMNDREDLL